jgi:hypothetical protein
MHRAAAEALWGFGILAGVIAGAVQKIAELGFITF